jgi:hypothetical protein
MRRFWVLAAAMTLILTGCAGDAEPARGPAPATSAASPASSPVAAAPATTTTAAPEPGRTSRRAAPHWTGGGLAGFVAVVRSRVPEVTLDRRDEEIEAVAQQACASLAAGKSADAIVDETRSLGTADAEATDQATARELVKLAIDTVCLDQRDRVDEF